jgi:glycosyltransferase involved in cell wall biosynthesis
VKIVGIIPCYNVERYCRSVIERTLPFVTRLILIDDGSTDETRVILQEMGRTHAQIRLILFDKNQGKGNALLQAIDVACKEGKFDALVTLDSDGQHAPEEIPRLMSAMQEGADLVIGGRDFSLMPPRSRFANTFMSLLLRWVSNTAPHDTQSGFRAMSPSFARAIVQHVKGNHYEMEMRCILLAIHWNLRIKEVPIETIYLDKNQSSHFSKISDSYKIMLVLIRYWITKRL